MLFNSVAGDGIVRFNLRFGSFCTKWRAPRVKSHTRSQRYSYRSKRHHRITHV